MEHEESQHWTSLTDLALGDLVMTPDERTLTVRLLALFPEGFSRPWRGGGFTILGDFDTVLVTGTSTASIGMYVPVESVPPHVAGQDMIAEGLAGFLAPHLPSDSTALEPLSWRCYRVAGQLEPLIVIYRGPQVLAFMYATSFDRDDVTVIALPRTGSRVNPVSRYATVVDLPAPMVEPPARTPSKTTIRTGRTATRRLGAKH
jgi:hypothetical protein